jgi:hypothetical protein
MFGLMLVLVSANPVGAPPASAPQAVAATLQSCAMESGRWVCRYAVPDIEIVPIPDSNIVADAPASVLGDAPTVDTPPIDPPVVDAPPPTALPGRAALPTDAGVLTEREAGLVARCADAGWVSLCLPADRRAARALQEQEAAYLAVRREVTRLLGRDRCEAAVRAALDGGYLALARETRDYCAVPSDRAATEVGTSAPSNAQADEPGET